jgi:hypothetical protein
LGRDLRRFDRRQKQAGFQAASGLSNPPAVSEKFGVFRELRRAVSVGKMDGMGKGHTITKLETGFPPDKPKRNLRDGSLRRLCRLINAAVKAWEFRRGYR